MRTESEALRELFESVQRGEVAPARAAEQALLQRSEQIGFAHLDHDRVRRCGLPEVIFSQGKRPDEVAEIFLRLKRSGVDVLATRVADEAMEAVLAMVPEAEVHRRARCVSLRQNGAAPAGKVGVVCAGTSDLPVADEAAVTAEVFGAEVHRVTDAGVAGLHRLLGHMETLRAMDALVVCAGMEGALPSVVGGLVAVPVLAVPTSVGYGASFGGVTALLGMLNSCAPNVSVVNIDNGFGAGYLATLIAKAERPWKR